jgi:chemotaxis protein MotC
MIRSSRAALILAALLSAGPAAAQTSQARFSDMADELQRVQTRIAHGDKAAYSAQLAQLKAMGAAIAAAKPETWTDKREADGLIIYILSGGSLAEVAPRIMSDAVAESERTLARGAVAYITNHEAEALKLLGASELSTLDARLAGQIAFARSVLESKRDPKAAMALLDWARLIAPGGLVEEAALRREIALVAEARDVSRAAMLIRQYVTRFAASVYAADFLRDLGRFIGRIGLADDPANYGILSQATVALPDGGRRDFLLTLAKAALISGRFDAASAASSEVLHSAPANSSDEARARLYQAAGRVSSGGPDAALADLQGVANSKLERSDATLLGAVREAAAQFRLAPSAGAVEAQAATMDDEKAGAAAPTIRQAEAALKRTASIAAAPESAP